MIRLQRPSTVPACLLDPGLAKGQGLCDLYDSSAPHRDGTAAMPIDDKVYNDASVRRALDGAQHEKCCYCESLAKPFEVEHYRPKGKVSQRRGEAVEPPGYYWLAYEWANLLYACVLCNQARRDEYGAATGKGTLFPLTDPAQRARSHHMSLADESPLLLNPYEEDPELHIKYNRNVPRGLTEKGRQTIEVLRLQGRSHLARTRGFYRRIEVYLELLLGSDGLSGEVEQKILDELWQLARDESEYAAMTRSALRAHGLL